MVIIFRPDINNILDPILLIFLSDLIPKLLLYLLSLMKIGLGNVTVSGNPG